MHALARYILCCSTFGLLLPFVLFAHGLGLTLTEETNGFIIDVDASAIELRAGETVNFNIGLLGADSGDVHPFDTVWVQLKQDGEVLLAGQLGVDVFGGTNVVYQFAEGGDYLLTTRFQDEEGNILAEAQFPLSVLGSTEEEGTNSLSFGLILLIVGMLGGAVLTGLLGKRRT